MTITSKTVEIERKKVMRESIDFLNHRSVRHIQNRELEMLLEGQSQDYYKGYFDGITECLKLFQESPNALFFAFHLMAGMCAKKYFEAESFPESLEV